MAKYQNMSEEESLRRSHSGVSNFKLTLVCLLCALGLPLFVASVATIGTGVLPDTVAIAGAVAGGVLSALSLLLIARFKR